MFWGDEKIMKYVSMAFYICGCFYVLFGIYAMLSNIKGRVNRQFSRLAISLAIWSYAYFISISVPTAEASAFWRSVTVFGWGVFPSLLVHLVLLIAEHKNLLKKRSTFIAIYLPAFINIILFSPFGYLEDASYKLVRTSFSWVNVFGNSIGGIWSSIYHILFTTLALVLLIRWWAGIEPGTILKRKSTYLLVSVLLPYFAGVAMDIMPFKNPLLPNLEVIYNVIPTMLLFVLLRTSGMLVGRSRVEVLPPGSGILPEENRFHTFHTASVIFFIGGASSFFTAYFVAGRDLAKELSLGLFVMACGTFLAFIPHITKRHSLQNTLFLITSILGQSYFIIIHVGVGAETIWAVYIVFLLFTIILDSEIHTYIFIGATLATQIVLWIMFPKTYAIIDNPQYFRRIFIILLTYYAVRYLTREYAAKMRGYQRYAKEQETLEKISNNFLSVDRGNIDEKIDEMLKLSKEILGFDQAYLAEFSADFREATVLAVYPEEGDAMESLPYRPGVKVTTKDNPVFETLIDQKRPIAYEDGGDEKIGEGGKEEDFLTSKGIKSYYILPVIVDENMVGIFVIEYRGKGDRGAREGRLAFLGIIVNILADTKKKILYEEKLYNFAYFDENTKLANRNMLKVNIEETLHDRKESERLVIFDVELDNLRMINDTFGHSVGEQVVMKSATMLEGLMQEGCTLSRVSQGKFVVVMPVPETDEQIEECARIIVGAFSDPILPEEGVESLFVTISIGIAVYPDDGRDADTLLKSADLAGYEARASGNQVVFCTDQLKSRIASNTILTNRLFRSLKNDEFSLAFQPQISCSTGKTVGVEALLRWTTVDKERVAPDTFIPMLEQTGLIHDVGLWVLEQALREHNRLVSKGFPPLRFSVNLSVVQFQKNDFVPNVARIIEQSRVDPKYIELEITESMLSKNFSDSIQKLGQLKELGLNIAIDDFGKGYSSLHRLDMVPFNRIKIDKSIIDDINFETKKSVIAKVIVSLARALMADITAEGVETKAQADFMKEIACDEIQGYLYSRPLSSEALEEFLKNEALRADA